MIFFIMMIMMLSICFHIKVMKAIIKNTLSIQLIYWMILKTISRNHLNMSGMNLSIFKLSNTQLYKTMYYIIHLHFGSQILDNTEYDEYIKEWCGSYKWKLLYRASEHKYTASSFHEYCDDKGPTIDSDKE